MPLDDEFEENEALKASAISRADKPMRTEPSLAETIYGNSDAVIFWEGPGTMLIHDFIDVVL